MATAINMGEIEEIHSKDAEGTVLNGDQSDTEMETQESDGIVNKKINNEETEEEEPMEVDESNSVDESRDVVDGNQENGSVDDSISTTGNDEDSQTGSENVLNNDENSTDSATEKDDEKNEDYEGEIEEVEDEDEQNDDVESKTTTSQKDEKEDDEVHEIEDDDDVIPVETSNNNKNDKIEETIELNDSDSEIIDHPNSPLENGTSNNKSEMKIIELTTPEKNPPKKLSITPRRSSRNIHKTKSYSDVGKEEHTTHKKATPSVQSSGESDIEEILPEDPLANIGDAIQIEKIPIKRKNMMSHMSDSSTIVVKDTKRLVEIASKSNPPTTGKKEPTLVIIDTNSILSGRGPVPVNKSNSAYSSLLPMALPAQGMYPPNMRATITPIPMTAQNQSSKSNNNNNNNNQSTTPVLPTLTDDMFVVEAPSFIVPYVYEKPPVKSLKTFVGEYKKEVNKGKDKDEDGKTEEDEKEEEEDKKDDDSDKDDDKMYSYFGSPLGKFFIEIGLGLVQEFVQNDLLKQQKRKREREHGKNPETIRTIQSLTKNLEYTKENNEPFRLPMKKCEFCPFKTESALALSYHLETPHVKNYIYKCNFCAYESRSPHDILFHMEAEHMVRGRLERALSFHQCPNCPFEENQKGKLSRHLMACAKKFKPERNLEPPLEWEPPAKIPRVPKMRQNLNANAAYQALSKSNQQQQQQLQLLAKMQLQANNAMNKRGGKTNISLKGTQLVRQSNVPGMVYKQAMSGGSVLVPTNYQLSGNQVFTQQASPKTKTVNTPSISITPLPRASTSSTGGAASSVTQQAKPGDTNSKNSFVICEICDGYIKDLEQLRNHMQWIHKVKIHPKMIYNRPPLNCQKCQFRFFTDQGLERHLLGSHGLVTSSMQEAANRSKDAGRCPVCGRVYQWKLLNHVARDHNMTLKPAHLSYKCTVCTATFGMYKQFENHVYSAHSVVAKRVMDKKGSTGNKTSDQALKPLKINDEITIIPQPPKAGSSKDLAGSSKNT